MTSSHGGPALAPGYTFCPPERELTDLYLRSKIAGEDLPGATGLFIHVADVYSAEPEKLTEAFDEAPGTGKGDVHKQLPVWYFFSPVRYVGGRKRSVRGGPRRKSRTIDGEDGKHWHSEHGERPVKGGSVYGGYEQNFSYMVKNASTGKDERAGWIMTEYGISPEHGGGDLVLCKIHRSPRPVASEAVMTAAVPVSNPVINSKKRKAAAVEHPQDPTASARPRRTAEQDERHLQAASTGEDAMTLEDAAEQHRRIGDEIIFDEDPVTEFFKMNFPLVIEPAAEEPEKFGDASDQAAPLSSFFQNEEQDFRSMYQNGMVMPVADPAMLPWAPAAQPEDAATAFVQTIREYEVPRQNYNDDGQMEASFGGELGAPYPTFSPEMIRRCSNDMMMPWRSHSSTSMAFSMF